MKPDTITNLINLNKSFYNSHSKDFSDSRNYNWQGFEKLSVYLFNNMKILDVGCGNARFAGFVNTKLNKFNYLGIDNSQKLLDIAISKNYPNCNFINSDFLQDFKSIKFDDKYDLIVALGVMHHIPSQKLRIVFVNYLKSLLSDNSKLVLSFWNFQNKIDKKKFIEPASIGINNTELDEQDYILTWERGELGYRYAHLYTDEEIQSLISESKLKIIENFKSDSKTGDGNRYFILKP